MRLVLDKLKIELENQQEIRDFWNIIMFALDLNASREGTDEPRMTDSELGLAKKLASLTEKSWD